MEEKEKKEDLEEKEKKDQIKFVRIVEISVLLGFISALSAGQDSVWSNVAIGIVVSALVVWGVTLLYTEKTGSNNSDNGQEAN